MDREIDFVNGFYVHKNSSLIVHLPDKPLYA